MEASEFKAEQELLRPGVRGCSATLGLLRTHDSAVNYRPETAQIGCAIGCRDPVLSTSSR